MKIRNLSDFTRNKKRLEKAMPTLKEKVIQDYRSIIKTEPKFEYQLRKLLSLNGQLWKNRGILSVLNNIKS